MLAFRGLKNNAGYTALNLIGLTIGLAACLLILLYIVHERSFDGFHSKKDRIYRVNYDILMGGAQVVSPSVPVFVGPYLKRTFPEVENMARFSTEWRPRTIRRGDVMFDEPGFAYADPTFLEVLDFKAVQGNLHTALSKPNTLVITQKMAQKYFGDTNPLGQILNFNNQKDYEVVAVMEDVPTNSHFAFNFLTSHYSLEEFAASENNEAWNDPNYTTWLLLKPGADPTALATKIEQWLHPTAEAGEDENTLHLPLEPLSAVHFNTTTVNFANQLAITDGRYLQIFGIVAALILLIACVNYINLATARASMRAKEVGVRKAVGARFGQLVGQFLGESLLLLLPAMLLAMWVVGLVLPLLNNLLDKQIPFRLMEPPFLAGLGVGWLTLAVLAGAYPALVLSRFRPVAALRGYLTTAQGSGAALRKGLVVFQFAISTLLIIGTLAVRAQLHYMQSKKLGLDKDQVVSIRGNNDLRPKLNAFCQKVQQISGIESVSKVWRSPFEIVVGNGFSLNPNPTDGSDWHLVGGVASDNQYLPTLGIELLGGRNFDPSKLRGDSTTNEFIVNEAFMRHYGLNLENTLGRKCVLGNAMQRGPGTIVGVVRDFHIGSLRAKVEPVVLYNEPGDFSSALLRIRSGQTANDVLSQVEAIWKDMVPMRPFNAMFLDEQYEKLYRTEQRLGTLMTICAGLAILVACLGLLGLAAFMVSRRTKEIGIRKVMGASTTSVAGLLAKDFLKLVLGAVVVAAPVAYYCADMWLSDFAYRIEVQWWMFAVAGIGALAVAFLTVGIQSARAALLNPIKSLRSE